MNLGATTGSWGLLLLAWLLALGATLGVLFIGEVMGQEPCVLCWFQRVFMFPLAIILAIACYSSDYAVWRYALPLAIGGGLVALGHSLLYAGLLPQPTAPCTATGPSCTDAGMTLFSFVPLPLLALAVFVSISILLLIIRRSSTP